MSIFDKFKHKKEDEAVSDKETAKVNVEKVEEKVSEKAPVKSEKKTETKKETVKKEVKKSVANSDDSYGILVRPLITEKATNLSQYNQYVFEVSVKANKIQIGHAIETRYGVKPKKVNVLNNVGRKVRHGRNTGRTKAWKKAIITLPKGKSIQIHEGV
jgi:large subunit ribosomal protein L23